MVAMNTHCHHFPDVFLETPYMHQLEYKKVVFQIVPETSTRKTFL